MASKNTGTKVLSQRACATSSSSSITDSSSSHPTPSMEIWKPNTKEFLSNAISAFSQAAMLFVCSVCGHIFHIWSPRCPVCGEIGALVEHPTVTPRESVELLGSGDMLTTGISCLDACYGAAGILRPSFNLFLSAFNVYSYILFLQLSSWFVAMGYTVLFFCNKKGLLAMDFACRKMGLKQPQFVEPFENFAISKISEIKPDIVFIESWIYVVTQRLSAEYEQFTKDLKEFGQHFLSTFFIASHPDNSNLGRLKSLADSVVVMTPCGNRSIELLLAKKWGEKEKRQSDCILQFTPRGLLDLADISPNIAPGLMTLPLKGVAAFSCGAVHYSVDEIISRESENHAGFWCDGAPDLWKGDYLLHFSYSDIWSTISTLIPDDYIDNEYGEGTEFNWVTIPNRTCEGSRIMDLAVIISILSFTNGLPLPQNAVFMASVDYTTGKLLPLDDMAQRIKAAKFLGYTRFIGAKAPFGVIPIWEEYDTYLDVWKMLGGSALVTDEEQE